MRGLPRRTKRGRRSQGSPPRWCAPGRDSHCLVKNNVADANNLVGRGIVDEPGWEVKSIAKEDPLPSFKGKLGALGGFDVDVGRATENTEVREVRVTSGNKGGLGDDRSSLGPRAIAVINHFEKSVTPKAIGKAKAGEKRLAAIRKCTPLTLNAGQQRVCVITVKRMHGYNL